MAYLGNCKICETGTVDCDLCRTCKDIIAEKALAGEEIVNTEIKALSDKKQFNTKQAWLKKNFEDGCESVGRDNWRKYKEQAERLQAELESMTKYLKGDCNSCCFARIRSAKSKECMKCRLGGGYKWIFNESKEGQALKGGE